MATQYVHTQLRRPCIMTALATFKVDAVKWRLSSFETNVPQLLSLAFSEGKPVVSPMTGAQLMFSTVDADRFLTYRRSSAEKLKEHGVTARQQF